MDKEVVEQFATSTIAPYERGYRFLEVTRGDEV